MQGSDVLSQDDLKKFRDLINLPKPKFGTDTSTEQNCENISEIPSEKKILQRDQIGERYQRDKARKEIQKEIQEQYQKNVKKRGAPKKDDDDLKKKTNIYVSANDRSFLGENFKKGGLGKKISNALVKIEELLNREAKQIRGIKALLGNYELKLVSIQISPRSLSLEERQKVLGGIRKQIQIYFEISGFTNVREIAEYFSENELGALYECLNLKWRGIESKQQH